MLAMPNPPDEQADEDQRGRNQRLDTADRLLDRGVGVSSQVAQQDRPNPQTRPPVAL
jgi:hypothetical protein